jgi:uncharacterized protein (DUF983 family)
MNQIAAILTTKCPRCRKGEMFQYSLLYNPLKFNKMHSHCPHCGENLYPELGFYIGAMYFSYALNVALVITMLFSMLSFGNPDAKTIFLSILLVMILTMPINFRISRAFMLHFFGGISYDPQKKGK